MGASFELQIADCREAQRGALGVLQIVDCRLQISEKHNVVRWLFRMTAGKNHAVRHGSDAVAHRSPMKHRGRGEAFAGFHYNSVCHESKCFAPTIHIAIIEGPGSSMRCFTSFSMTLTRHLSLATRHLVTRHSSLATRHSPLITHHSPLRSQKPPPRSSPRALPKKSQTSK